MTVWTDIAKEMKFVYEGETGGPVRQWTRI